MNPVRVRLFARVRDLADAACVELNLKSGATVGRLRQELGARWPAIAEMLPRCAIAINGEYAHDGLPIPPNAELAVIPPVSGGS